MPILPAPSPDCAGGAICAVLLLVLVCWCCPKCPLYEVGSTGTLDWQHQSVIRCTLQHCKAKELKSVHTSKSTVGACCPASTMWLIGIQWWLQPKGTPQATTAVIITPGIPAPGPSPALAGGPRGSASAYPEWGRSGTSAAGGGNGNTGMAGAVVVGNPLAVPSSTQV